MLWWSSDFHCCEFAGTFFSHDGNVSLDVGSFSVVVAVSGLGLRLSDCNYAQQLVLPDDRENSDIDHAMSTTAMSWIGFYLM